MPVKQDLSKFGISEKQLISNLQAFEKYNEDRKRKAVEISRKLSTIGIFFVPLLFHFNHKDLPGYVETEENYGGIPYFNIDSEVRQAADMLVPGFNRLEKELGMPPKSASRRSAPSQNDSYYGGGGGGGDPYGGGGDPYGGGGMAGGRAAKSSGKAIIESLILMGSVGSAAQNAKSDFDYWLVVDEKKLDPKDLDFLKKKLAIIEEWGEKQGAELHFFITDVNRVRVNDFGTADKESAGSSQARLLKEEFYRTALHVAGKVPVWMITPPAIDDSIYQKAKEIIDQSTQLDSKRFVDLGNLGQITISEFFGAALWQINKAFDSPFKSVMKMATLESFIDPEGDSMLLCDELKKNILAKSEAVKAMDPYLVMFNRLLEFYERKKKSNVVDLLHKCLYNKVNVKLNPLTSKKTKISFKEKTMLQYTAEWKWDPGTIDDLNKYEEWDFDRTLKLGNDLHSFLIETYKNLTDQLKSRDDVKHMISEADLTVLGRKLFSFYSKKPNKIEPIKRASDDALRQDSCTFMPTIVRGKKTVWTLLRGNMVTEVARKQSVDYAELRKSTSLAELVAWATINQVIDPGTFLHIIQNPLPITLKSIQLLIKTINEVLPYKSISSIPNAPLLSGAQNIKLIVVINFVSQTWAKQVEDITMIYRNSHGEIFCETQSGKAALNRLIDCISKASPNSLRGPGGFYHIFILRTENSTKLEKQMRSVMLNLLKQSSAPSI